VRTGRANPGSDQRLLVAGNSPPRTCPPAGPFCLLKYGMSQTIFTAPPTARPARRRRLRPASLLPPIHPGFRFTPRDGAIIDAVWRYRCLTTPQIARLFFPTAGGAVSSQCLTRLRHLTAAGYLARSEQPQVRTDGRKPSLFFLDQRGAAFLVEDFGVEPAALDWKPRFNNASWIFLSHLLATNEVRIAVSLAAWAHGWTLEAWLDDRSLKKAGHDYVELTDDQGRAHRSAVVPDGYFVLSRGQVLGHCFLELDRGTIPGNAAAWEKRDWARKVQVYLEYYRSGLFQSRYKTRSCRILTVTTSQARLATLKGVTERAGGRGRFWFTTMDHITPASVLSKAIWAAAGSDNLHSLAW